jgi:hypothetical protein
MTVLPLQRLEVKARIVARENVVESAEVGENGLKRAAEQELRVLNAGRADFEMLDIVQQSRSRSATVDDGMPLLLCGKQAFDRVAMWALQVREDRAEHVRIGEMEVREWPNAEITCDGIKASSEKAQDLAIIGAWVRRSKVGWIVHDTNVLEVDHYR